MPLLLFTATANSSVPGARKARGSPVPWARVAGNVDGNTRRNKPYRQGDPHLRYPAAKANHQTITREESHEYAYRSHTSTHYASGHTLPCRRHARSLWLKSLGYRNYQHAGPSGFKRYAYRYSHGQHVPPLPADGITEVHVTFDGEKDKIWVVVQSETRR